MAHWVVISDEAGKTWALDRGRLGAYYYHRLVDWRRGSLGALVEAQMKYSVWWIIGLAILALILYPMLKEKAAEYSGRWRRVE